MFARVPQEREARGMRSQAEQTGTLSGNES
jgi:hypothetical protein